MQCIKQKSNFTEDECQKCPAIVRGELAQIQRSWAEIWYNLVLLLLQGIVSQVIRGTVIYKLLHQCGKAKSLTRRLIN